LNDSLPRDPKAFSFFAIALLSVDDGTPLDVDVGTRAFGVGKNDDVGGMGRIGVLFWRR
jgi:hypothetical protein